MNDRPPHDDRVGRTGKPPGDERFLGEIYEIALDPGNLTGFIDRLGSETPDIEESRDELLKIDALSALFRAHLERAEAFLDRVQADSTDSPAQAALRPFRHSGAMLIDGKLEIAHANGKAVEAFAVGDGGHIDDLPFIDEDLDRLVMILRRMHRNQRSESVLIHMRTRPCNGEDTSNVVVFHAHWLIVKGLTTTRERAPGGHILLASTELSWPDALDQTLTEVFGLTEAERDIVRALVEGKVLKTIARDRERSLGTVRVQVKSILAKTRAHSQTELIRVVLSLMQVVKRAPDPAQDAPDAEISATLTTMQFEPYKTLIRPDGRRMDYLVQGDPDGAAVFFSHMGYGFLRWPPKALAMAKELRLKVISIVRPGFGDSDRTTKNDDVLAIIRDDTAAVLDHLSVERCTYVVQGNDMLFALDFAHTYRHRVSALIGLGVRLPLLSEQQYAGMGKWHRFLLSNARYAPHLLYFTCKAAFTLCRKIGTEALFRNIHKDSPADLSVLDDPEVKATLYETTKLAISDTHQADFAYARELLDTESDWHHLVEAARNLPTWLVSGGEDPLGSLETIAAYEAAFPWLSIEVMADAGQLLFYKKFVELIPRIAATAHGRDGLVENWPIASAAATRASQ